jgi:hypothetical protein
MNQVDLIRFSTGDHGTFGVISCPGLKLFSAEPPWKQNRKNVSCIPAGEYTVTRYVSRKFGRVYLVQGTAPRTYILTHTGNLAGDMEKGLLTHTHGCIMPGLYLGTYKNQQAVMASRTAFRKFESALGNDDFKLIITNLFKAGR